MAVVDVQNTKGEQVSQIDLADSIFNIEVKNSILHQVVKMQLACRRAGTASVKNRSDVKGSNKKLYRQKGTGNARSGDIKSPLRKGGGVVFGPVARSHAFKLTKKMRRLALKMALSAKYKNDCVSVLDRFDLEQIKTKKFVDIIQTLKTPNALIITESKNENLELSARNVPGIKVMRHEGLNVYDILKYQNLILLEASVKNIEGRLLQ